MKTIHSQYCPVCNSHNLLPFLECKDYFATKQIFSIVKCGKCHFALTQGFPSETEIGRYYEVPEYVSHSDTNKGIINKLYHWARRIALKGKSKTIDKYAPKDGETLLDIGCGTGYFLNRMRSQKWVVTGIEKAESARIYAKKKFNLDTQEPDYLYKIGDTCKDVITMWHVLEHLEHLNEVMAHSHKILEDDGIMVIALPNKESYDAKHYKENWAAYDVPRHLWHFSPSDLETLANNHQFCLTAIKPMYFDAFYIAMLSEKNKGATLSTIVGLTKGGIFFLRSLFDKKKCSSLIYILKKKKQD